MVVMMAMMVVLVVAIVTTSIIMSRPAMMMVKTVVLLHRKHAGNLAHMIIMKIATVARVTMLAMVPSMMISIATTTLY